MRAILWNLDGSMMEVFYCELKLLVIFTRLLSFDVPVSDIVKPRRGGHCGCSMQQWGQGKNWHHGLKYTTYINVPALLQLPTFKCSRVYLASATSVCLTMGRTFLSSTSLFYIVVRFRPTAHSDSGANLNSQTIVHFTGTRTRTTLMPMAHYLWRFISAMLLQFLEISFHKG